ncbi:MAG: PP2C family protein-serine/threonine phosphatase [Bryobacterales bacterium]|nr:PP2C family protein-serine/threonine phosphatase [Bryobacterales bacterium]
MIGILNGDVSGKGAAAALYAALAGGLLRAAARERLSPADALGSANQALLDRKVGTTFLAAMYAKWHPGKRLLVLSGAGMPYPYLYRHGQLERLQLPGIPLGLFRTARYEDEELALQPGDLVVSVSDGFTESLDGNNEAYGEQRLRQVLDANREQSAAAILEQVFADVGSFSVGTEQADDRTAIIMRVTQ